MKRGFAGLLVTALVTLSHPSVARAGMPSITLTDVARTRVQTISFFLLGVLACAWVVQWIWNSVGRDFPRLPRLSYPRALGVVTLWGLLFVLVLTMISGARELMTPGAWKKSGLTYKLNETAPSVTPDRHEDERRQALERLRIALWTYARAHQGQFPADNSRSTLPDEVWRVPDPSGMRYLYVGGLVADQGDSPVAYEPGLFGTRPLALLADGRIMAMTPDELRRRLATRPMP